MLVLLHCSASSLILVVSVILCTGEQGSFLADMRSLFRCKEKGDLEVHLGELYSLVDQRAFTHDAHMKVVSLSTIKKSIEDYSLLNMVCEIC
jgi:hypothetical protein